MLTGLQLIKRQTSGVVPSRLGGGPRTSRRQAARVHRLVVVDRSRTALGALRDRSGHRGFPGDPVEPPSAIVGRLHRHVRHLCTVHR